MRFYYWYRNKRDKVYRIATDVALYHENKFLGFIYDAGDFIIKTNMVNPTYLIDKMFIEEEPNGFINREIIKKLFTLKLMEE